MMRISVFGLGYVGCVTAACLAKAGHEVVGVDIDTNKVAIINDGRSPIVEQGLEALIAEMVAAKRLRATSSVDEAVTNSQLALICVGTPSLNSGQLDVSGIERVGEEVGRALRRSADPYTVVLRSTVIPGTTDRVLIPALLSGSGRELGSQLRVAMNPEFMREGSSLRDFDQPAYTLVGNDDPETHALLRSLYSGVDAPFVVTDVRTAEMVKYVSNTFHALKVCFSNEIGDICSALNVDAQEAMRIFRLDQKLNISEAYLRPGFAFGGSCLPKDIRALLYAARTVDVHPSLLSTIIPSNEGLVRRAVETILKTRKRKVGIVGLSFKPGTDDLRESPMVVLVETLIGKGCDLRILDRNVSVARLVGANRRYIEETIPHIASLLCTDIGTVLAHSEVLVIGNAGKEAEQALASVPGDRIVIDLTRGAVAPVSLSDRSV